MLLPRAARSYEPAHPREPDYVRGARHVRRAASGAHLTGRVGLPDHRRAPAFRRAGLPRPACRPSLPYIRASGRARAELNNYLVALKLPTVNVGRANV